MDVRIGNEATLGSSVLRLDSRFPFDKILELILPCSGFNLQ